MLKTNVLVSEKKWHKQLFDKIKIESSSTKWILIENREKFEISNLKKYNIDKIFIPHWSYLIKPEIYNNYECILFHMTDLPFGRGGSPLQNLILRKHKKTKISAIRVQNGLDTGPIYIKKKLSLDGTASEIFQRAIPIINQMIYEIINKNIKPIHQKGKVVLFERRTPEQSNIKDIEEINEVFDYIRMLDCNGYPKAFLETANLKYEFSNTKIINKNQLEANVRIFKK